MQWKSGMRQTPARLNDPGDKPMVRLLQVAAGTSLVNNTNTPIAFDGEDYDTHGLHSTSANLSYVTISAAAGDGLYLCKGTVFVAARTDYTTIGAVVWRNGAPQAPWARYGPNASNVQRSVDVEARLSLLVGDRVELIGLQQNSAAGTVVTPFGSSFASVFEVEKLRGPA